MPVKVIHIQPRSRAGALALGAGVVVVGTVLVVVGLSLLLALTAGGIMAGTGYALYRRIAGRGKPGAPRQTLGSTRSGLDPRLEVRAPGSAEIRPLPGPDDPNDVE